jgi:4-hydroxy-3-polyprenylbenzoate decarboxylase
MAARDLREFLRELESSGELLRVKEEVSCRLEIAEITDRVCKGGGPALLFERPSGHSIPVVTNLFGSHRRMKMALGIDRFEEVGEEVLSLLSGEAPKGILGAFSSLPKLGRLAASVPTIVERAPCQEVVLTDNADLGKLPVLTAWPGDAGPFITMPVVITKDPVSGRRNVGTYRMQIYDGKTAGIHWHRHKAGTAHYRDAEALGRELPVAVALGPDPIVTFAATAPLPESFDELLLAGFLRRRPVELVRCRTVDLEVPADSQIVIEGVVHPGERRAEGPVGNSTGHYSPADDFPVLHVTAVTMRRSPVFPAAIPGRPPTEDSYLGKATERIFLPLIKMQLPEIVDLNLPIEGAFRNLAFVSIDKRYPGHARKVACALWGMGKMALTRTIVIFDREVDVQNLSELLWRLGCAVDPRRDTFFVDGPLDILDHASATPAYGSKMGIDATRKLPEEGHPHPWPEILVQDPEVKARVDALWPKLGIPPHVPRR